MSKNKLSPQQDKVLSALCRHGQVTNLFLNGLCHRFGGRLHELRRLGCVIDCKQTSKSIYVYTLKKMPGRLA
jgi:hypothetical protein